MAKKKKTRVELRKNRTKPPRERDWTRGFAQHGYGDEATAGVQSGIESFLAEAWPEFAQVPVTHRWSGTMGFSPDGLPVVGVLPHRPAVAFGVGFTGHGLGFALVVAQAVVDVLQDKKRGGLFDVARLTPSSLPCEPERKPL